MKNSSFKESDQAKENKYEVKIKIILYFCVTSFKLIQSKMFEVRTFDHMPGFEYQ